MDIAKLIESENKIFLNSGMTSNAYIIENDYIMLEGKLPRCIKLYKDMSDDLNTIDKFVRCVEIPREAKMIQPCEKFPYGCLIYKMVKGYKLNIKKLNTEQKEKLSEDIAKFIFEVHTADIYWSRENSIRHETGKIKKNIKILKNYLTKIEIDLLNKYSYVFENYLKSREQFCITHGDLWEENFIVDKNNKLVGVIDFGNFSYFLPEVDYASMWNMDEDFLDRLLKYSKENISKYSVLLFVVHREVCSFEYVLEQKDDNETICQIEKIRQTLALIKCYLH